MPKITPWLWFNGQAEEAANFYVSLFPNSKVGEITRYTEAGPAPAGTVMTVEFELDGQQVVGLNGGPEFPFSEAVSFQIDCADQAEVDRYWNGLLAGGGKESVCGWLKDRFGFNWQVVPSRLHELMADPDREKARRVTDAMFKMVKIDVRKLEEAARG
jgi:predicted 3-demethylubiquinone-9 3-methyltransferase (glyoxalase superfamily)